MKTDYSFKCRYCPKIHKRDTYCIAQQAQGHEMRFVCEGCSRVQWVPKLPPRK